MSTQYPSEREEIQTEIGILRQLSQHPRAETEIPCADGKHQWLSDAAEGDTCHCGEWYRYANRIEATPTPETTP